MIARIAIVLAAAAVLVLALSALRSPPKSFCDRQAALPWLSCP